MRAAAGYFDPSANFAKLLVGYGAVAAAEQLFEMSVGLRKRFDAQWVAVQALSGAANAKIGLKMQSVKLSHDWESRALAGMMRSGLGVVEGGVIYGQIPNMETIALRFADEAADELGQEATDQINAHRGAGTRSRSGVAFTRHYRQAQLKYQRTRAAAQSRAATADWNDRATGNELEHEKYQADWTEPVSSAYESKAIEAFGDQAWRQSRNNADRQHQGTVIPTPTIAGRKNAAQIRVELERDLKVGMDLALAAVGYENGFISEAANDAYPFLENVAKGVISAGKEEWNEYTTAANRMIDPAHPEREFLQSSLAPDQSLLDYNKALVKNTIGFFKTEYVHLRGAANDSGHMSYHFGKGLAKFGFFAIGGVDVKSVELAGAIKLFENQFSEHKPVAPTHVIANEMLKKVNGRFNYVVTVDNELVVGKYGIDFGRGHIDLAGGRSVKAAGEVKIVDRKIKYIDNSSGHYLTTGSSAKLVAENAFRKIGFNVEEKYIEKNWIEDASLPRRGAWREK